MYAAVIRETWQRYPFNWGYNARIGIIGVSYSAEYIGKGLYESTVGRITEWLARDEPRTNEDRFAVQVAQDYARFIHATPWYAFPFGARVRPLWGLPPVPGASRTRRWERRLSLSGELAAKGGWGWLLGTATGAAYAPEDHVIQARMRDLSRVGVDADARVQVLSSDEHGVTVTLPRYEPFTDVVTTLARKGGHFIDIAGNRTILVTAITPIEWDGAVEGARSIGSWNVLTHPGQRRLALAVDVARVGHVMVAVEGAHGHVEHVYDY